MPSGLLELVTIQFPDPWFKKKHQKRRVLQPALLRGIAAALAPGGTLFLQSDVPAVLAAMVGPVEASGGFERLEPCPATEENPLPVADGAGNPCAQPWSAGVPGHVPPQCPTPGQPPGRPWAPGWGWWAGG